MNDTQATVNQYGENYKNKTTAKGKKKKKHPVPSPWRTILQETNT